MMSLKRMLGRRLRDVDLIVPALLEKALLSSSRAPSSEEPISLPLVAIIGPPRVGSTLMAQLLASQYRFFYLDNFQHAFLRYPYLAFRFSNRFIPKRTICFESDHGFEKGFGGLSEGNFFWAFWFDMPVAEKDPQPSKSRLQHVQRVLNQIYLITGKPMLNAAGALSFYLAELNRRFEKLVVVNMRRDPVTNALSLLRARKLMHSNLNNWWSIRPAACVLSESPYHQIVCQVVETYRQIKQQRAAISEVPIVDVRYEDLCGSPQATLDRVVKACRDASIDLLSPPALPVIPDLSARGLRWDELEDVEQFYELFANVQWDEVWS
jgi:hypothetical protein